MVPPGRRLLAAVSGGPDSVAMLSALVALRRPLGISLRAGYVDHGLRPAAARREAALVQKLCRMWAVPFHRVAVRLRRRGGQSLEEAARLARYEALAGLAHRKSCGAIAVGHTADDQAETVLMWILRGTGTAGLAGIPPVREVRSKLGPNVRVIRPLLACSRQEVLAYLKGQGIRPLLDRSNLSPRYLRNRVRSELLPLLEREYNPQVRRHLCRLAEILREDWGWIRAEAQRQFSRAVRQRAGQASVNRTLLRKAHPALRRALLRLTVERLQGDHHGFRSAHWEELDELLDASGAARLDLPHRFQAEVRPRGRLILRRAALSARRESGRLTLKEGAKGKNG